MSGIKNKFINDRPREKLARLGASGLSDLELLQAVIGSGVAGADVTSLARELLKLVQVKGDSLSYDDVCKIRGIGAAKATAIFASFEFWRRQLTEPDQPVLDAPEKVLPLLADIRDKKQEYLVALTLDGANRLIRKRVITIGTLTASLVHPREVFAPAIEDRAAAVIVAHNHPSGSLSPSPADSEVTERLCEAGKLLGITLVDHLIVTKDDYRSIIK
ncbi:MAG: DNA repair protein RadC [Candidatus Nomurabacteria bacterium]|jgi:DNA repair protein RadC|nr:DNA repair protein RadC [Candidatus Nomurabacteria bacterium]